MEAIHILLAIPSQFDKKSSHYGCSNKYSFDHHGRKIVFSPLIPSEVIEDQIKMREKMKKKENKNKKERKKKEKEKERK